MDNQNRIPLSLDYEGKHYRGSITPSEEKGSNGIPVFFRVIVDGQFFAYLCCADHGWVDRDKSGTDPGLVGAIGEYVKRFYE